MAIKYSEIAREQNGIMTGTAPLKGKGGLASGTVCIATSIVEIDGTKSINDVIHLVRLPKNAVIVPHLCRVSGAAMGTAFSVKIGTDVDGEQAAYSAALDIKAAHDVAFTGGVKLPVEHEAPYWVTATITAATTPTNGAKTTVYIAYRIN